MSLIDEDFIEWQDTFSSLIQARKSEEAKSCYTDLDQQGLQTMKNLIIFIFECFFPILAFLKQVRQSISCSINFLITVINFQKWYYMSA